MNSASPPDDPCCEATARSPALQPDLAARGPDESLRVTIDSLPVLAWTAAVDGAIEYLNRPWLEYVGVEAGQALGWGWSVAIHPEDRTRVEHYWRQILASGEPGEIDARLRHASGEYRWFLIRANPQRDPAGRIVRWYGANTEIESRRNAEHVARRREAEIRRIIDGIPGHVFTTGADGVTDFINRRMLDYFGRSVEELARAESDGTVHPDDSPRVFANWQRAVASGQPSETELRLRRHDGAYRWFHYRAVPERDADGRIGRWYVLATDIDDLRRAQEALRHNESRLSRAMQLASLSELSASIAHEVNQPLAAVVANGHACRQWLSADPPNVERAAASADRIVRDGNAAAEVIRRVRSLFERAPPEKAPLDLNDVVRDVFGLVADEFRGRDVIVDVHLQPDLPPVPADRIQIQQVVANLVRNGADAMAAVDRERRLSVRTRRESGEVIVEVADCGTGIADLRAVFEPFYSTKPTGMGMGLAICRSIVEAHGARLWAGSNRPYGAVFAFALPVDAHSGGTSGPGLA